MSRDAPRQCWQTTLNLERLEALVEAQNVPIYQEPKTPRYNKNQNADVEVVITHEGQVDVQTGGKSKTRPTVSTTPVEVAVAANEAAVPKKLMALTGGWLEESKKINDAILSHEKNE